MTLSARAVLFGDDPEALSRALHEQGVAGTAVSGVRRLSASSLRAVDDGIGSVAEGFLELDLGDVLVAGWRKYSALLDAARRTLDTPGSSEVVVLATHQLTSTYTPRVDLVYGETTLNSLEFTLTIVFDIVGLSAVVQGGELIALRGGECLVTVTLAFEGAELGKQERKVDLGLLVNLHPPLPLVEPTPRG